MVRTTGSWYEPTKRASHSYAVMRSTTRLQESNPATMTGLEMKASSGKMAATRKAVKLHVKEKTMSGFAKARLYKT